MGGMAKLMPRTFGLFTAGAMASLALPGMSGFVGELMVFLGITTSDVYSSNFKITIVLLSAVGVILTPIYLLSMLREVFYGNQSKELELDSASVASGINFVPDVKPRELFITACLLVPIIGIGLYPKLITQTYDVKTVQVATHARQYLPIVASQEELSQPSDILMAPTLADTEIQTLVSVIE